MDINFTSRQDAIREITSTLGEYADQHDIEAIADEALTTDASGYSIIEDENRFWEIVAKHAQNN